MGKMYAVSQVPSPPSLCMALLHNGDDVLMLEGYLKERRTTIKIIIIKNKNKERKKIPKP